MKTSFQEHKLRERGPQTVLGHSEVITIEAVGNNISTLAKINKCFVISVPIMPNLSRFKKIHRTTFVRQAANLWKGKRESLAIHLAL